MRSSRFVVVCWFFLLVTSIVQASYSQESPSHEQLTFYETALTGVPDHDGQKAIGTDGEGVFLLLAGAKPRVYSVAGSGGVELIAELDDSLWAVNAWAVGDGGDLLIARTGVHQVQIFRKGKAVKVPPTVWMVSGVAVSKAEPVVALAPVRFENGGVSDLAGQGRTFSLQERTPVSRPAGR